MKINYFPYLVPLITFMLLSPGLSGQHLCQPSPYQSWWDVLHYDLSLDFNMDETSCLGVLILKAVVTDTATAEIELDFQQDPGKHIKRVQLYRNGTECPIELEYRDKSFLVRTRQSLFSVNDTISIRVVFGAPFVITESGPWKSGLTVGQSASGMQFWGFSCQADGASFLFPCKDVLADEPQLGIGLTYSVPKGYTAEGNGKLISVKDEGETVSFRYQVTQPINPYNITFYIGDLVRLTRNIKTGRQDLDCVFSVLKEHQAQGAALLAQLDTVVRTFEYWCGPYPFAADGCKIVEAPYLGMEHQSAVAYGNRFLPGYLGKDRSETGVGLLFDFILVHEMAHEWWGNNVSVAHMCDFWINEGWASYMESLYAEYLFGREKADLYRIGKQKLADNGLKGRGDCVQCTRNVRGEYDKPAAMIHQLRLLMKNDDRFRQMMLGIQENFHHRTVTSEEMMTYIQSYFDLPLEGIFRQYLDTDRLPALIMEKVGKERYRYRWEGCVSGFEMPVTIIVDQESLWLYPNEEWKEIRLERDAAIKADPIWLIGWQLP